MSEWPALVLDYDISTDHRFDLFDFLALCALLLQWEAPSTTGLTRRE